VLRTIATIEMVLCWLAWWYPPIFLAPHWQKRPSVTANAPSVLGLLLESAAYVVACAWRTSGTPETWRLAAAMIPGPIAVVLMWSAVTHLGRQFRIRAGVWEDHELVRSGPYAIVRHPIYASMLAMLAAMLLLLTAWPGAAVALALFVAGTETRVRTEDALLAARFPSEFSAYKRSVPAYLPFVR